MKKIVIMMCCFIIVILQTSCTNNTASHFDNNKTYVDKNEIPIKPEEYQSMLGKGLDVTWSEFPKQMESYNVKMVEDFKEAGVKHVRIRIKDDVTEDLLNRLDVQINECLANGIIPVIAYQGHEFKENPTDENMNKVTEWWRLIAQHYASTSYLLSFDLIIEPSDAINKLPDRLNQLYEQTVDAIRESNPYRIIMIAPRLRSDPNYLSELVIPSNHNGYIMAEWHFYASGPDKTNEKKKWTDGNDNEKQLINDQIKTALNWQESTGIKVWVGAWMPGNYNKGDDYSVQEQAEFAAYMTSALTQAGIPFAVNADTKYYDAVNNEWIEKMKPVIKAIFY